MQDITLYFQDAHSDKVYSVRIEPSEGGKYAVYMAYGRRGGTMQTGTKGVSFSKESAEAKLKDLVAEKLAKGYKPGDAAAEVVMPVTSTSPDAPKPGWLVPPMLLNEVTWNDIENLIDDPLWVAQCKWDGWRIQIRRIGDKVSAYSRTNKPVALPKAVVEAVLALKPTNAELVLDGELVGDIACLFDVLQRGATSLLDFSYDKRLLVLNQLLRDNKSAALIETPTWTQHKDAMIATLKEKGSEGVVFKRLTAPYTSGRPASSGNALKYKFKASATLRIASVGKDNKQSAEVALADGTVVASVSLIGRPKVSAGQICDVEYLYAHRNGGLTQPVFKCLRTDKVTVDTAFDLQYKNEARA